MIRPERRTMKPGRLWFSVPSPQVTDGRIAKPGLTSVKNKLSRTVIEVVRGHGFDESDLVGVL